MHRLRNKLSYANVTASLALFIALGGVGYAAIKLPKNSVGTKQLRTSAVKSKEIKNGAVTRRDIKGSTRSSFGRPVFHAAVNSAGQLVRGNATSGGAAPGDGLFTVRWRRDVSRCNGAATLASVPGGVVTDPPPGSIILRYVGAGIQVQTFDAAGAPTDLPFTVVVAC